MTIGALLENLINKKFYDTKEEIQSKLDVFFAMNKISAEEYSALTLKVEEMYQEPITLEEIMARQLKSEDK